MTKKLLWFLWVIFISFGIFLWSTNMTYAANPSDIVIEVTASAWQELTINKYFTNDYTVDRWDGTPIAMLGSNTTHTYTTTSWYTVTLSLAGWATRWKFLGATLPLIPKIWTTATDIKIVTMPSLSWYFGDNATSPWDSFFFSFNSNWSLTSLPAWSFDTSNITTAWNNFFFSFNSNWSLTSLPAWSFDTSNITIAWDTFFTYFNYYWQLTSLPIDSFDTSNITTAGDYFFSDFNNYWQLTSLPIDSFDTSNITTAGDYFFSYFNSVWFLASLPNWSFNLSGITTAGNYFFTNFNNNWQLASLPIDSFNITNITTVGDSFFSSFNRNWSLASLPAWSFDTSNIITAWNNFFSYFNWGWSLTSLPDWSFNLSSITTAGNYFFNEFNTYWSLTSLPAWSFDTSSIVSVWNYFFNGFNAYWSLISLPAWSFDTSDIADTRDNFFYGFNDWWQLTSLPIDSFDTSNIITAWDNFFQSFNSYWSLTSLPNWSFDTSNIVSVWNYFFYNFNDNWSLAKVTPGSGVSIKNIAPDPIQFYYNSGGNQSETVAPGDSFADYGDYFVPIDIIPPTVTLVWSWVVTISLWSWWSDPGAAWADDIDWSWTIISATSWTVNTWVVWTYILDYTYTDVAGNAWNTVTRTINIVDITLPAVPNSNSSFAWWGWWSSSNINDNKTNNIHDTAITIWPIGQAIFNPSINSDTCFSPTDKLTIDQWGMSSYQRIAHQMLYSYWLTTIPGTLDFWPNRNITRAEAAKFLVQFAQNVLCRQKIQTYNNRFKDIDNMHPDLQKNIKLSYEYGIFYGSEWWLFRPDDMISRDELIATTIRLLTTRYDDLTWSNWVDNYKNTLSSKTTISLIGTTRINITEVIYNLYKENNFILEDSGYILE